MSADKVAEIRRMYFAATPKTIQRTQNALSVPTAASTAMKSVTGSAGMNATSWPITRSCADAAPGMRPGRRAPSANWSSTAPR